MTPFIIAALILLSFFAFVFIWSLCRVAALADQRMYNEPPERPRRCRACQTPMEYSGICEDCQLARDEYQRGLDEREMEIMTGRI